MMVPSRIQSTGPMCRPLSNTEIRSDPVAVCTNGEHSRPGANGSEYTVSGRSVSFSPTMAAVITIVSAGRHANPTTGAAAPPPAYADSQIPVEVKVRAALDDGELYVNGRSYGPLRLEEAILLRLLPGSYHFEAREVDGTQVGKDVLVEPGVPTEVVLIPATD